MYKRFVPGTQEYQSTAQFAEGVLPTRPLIKIGLELVQLVLRTRVQMTQSKSDLSKYLLDWFGLVGFVSQCEQGRGQRGKVSSLVGSGGHVTDKECERRARAVAEKKLRAGRRVEQRARGRQRALATLEERKTWDRRTRKKNYTGECQPDDMNDWERGTLRLERKRYSGGSKNLTRLTRTAEGKKPYEKLERMRSSENSSIGIEKDAAAVIEDVLPLHQAVVCTGSLFRGVLVI
ncbi:hypothetical protein B0H13DRAFT_2267941 [Mycena leptocephala]|nr:hypothetical protein B0H13DRAFT_2267941 [Mycena leptocephala]